MPDKTIEQLKTEIRAEILREQALESKTARTSLCSGGGMYKRIITGLSSTLQDV